MNSLYLRLSLLKIFLLHSTSQLGIITSSANGVIKLYGLCLAFVGQVFCPALSTNNRGVIVSVGRDYNSWVTVRALYIDGRISELAEGFSVFTRPSLATIYLGNHVIGSILNCLGNIIDLNEACKEISPSHEWVVESPSVGLIDRQSVFEPMQTGIFAVDAMIPIGRGQRELILGDRYTGKTTIGLDAIINQRFQKVLAIFNAVGTRASEVLGALLCLACNKASSFLTLVVATASSGAVAQYYSAYTAASVADYFMLVRNLSCLVLHDDLTRHAVAYREISLLLGRPPGREAYPGDVFFVHSRLLERAAMVSSSLGGGSATALPIIETLGGDVSGYITTNVISITDGQLFLSSDKFLRGVRPAIDVGLSVTRVGSAAQWSGMQLVGSAYKLRLTQYYELEAFSQFAADLSPESKAALQLGKQTEGIFIQPASQPYSLPSQLLIASTFNNGYSQSVGGDQAAEVALRLSKIPSWLLLFIPPRMAGHCISTPQS